jgi:HopA1 effector protein family
MNFIQTWQPILTEIAEKLEIHPEGWISHQDYPQDPPPDYEIAAFQQLPEDLQQQYLKSEVADLLQSLYFSGSYVRPEQDALANTTSRGVDLQFFESLHQSNCGEGYFDPDWSVHQHEADGTYAVQKSGLTLHVNPNKYLSPKTKSAEIGDSVSVLLPKNWIDQDYYVAVSNSGFSDSQNVQYFFNFSADVASSILSKVTETLNNLRIPFLFRVLYSPEEYFRYDVGVLTLNHHHRAIVDPFLQSIHTEHQEHFRSQVPLLTKEILRGIAIALLPKGESDFGVYCGQHLAEVLVQNQSVEHRFTKMQPMLNQIV